METIKTFGGLTQVELSEATGLSAATVSTLVKQLTSTGVLNTRPTSRSGRRARMVTLAPHTGLAAGVHIGDRNLRIILGDFNHDVLADRNMPLPQDHPIDTVLDRVALLIVDMLEIVGSTLEELAGITIGMPAPVDTSTGVLSVRGLLPGWDDEHIGAVMTKRLGRPVYVENDANLAALAEVMIGATRPVLDSVYVRASYGTGAGVVLGGRVYRGFAGTAGEIGHVQVDPGGAICRCGRRGCLNTVVGSQALLTALRASHGPLTLRDVVTRATTGDPGCSRVLTDAARAIGRVVAGLCQSLNPQVVCIGGELAEAEEAFLAPLTDTVQEHMLPNQVAPTEVVTSSLAGDDVVMGGLIHVLESTDFFTHGGDQQ